jgi:hypothetical protein
MEWPRPASAEARDNPLVPVNLGAPGRHLRAVAVNRHDHHVGLKPLNPGATVVIKGTVGQLYPRGGQLC